MLFDTDVFIWIQRGHLKAARLVEGSPERFISVQTYMELLQGAADKKQHLVIKDMLKQFHFTVLPFSENIGHRASVYIEEYALAIGLYAGDAIIAATATENNLPLTTSNAKHFKSIKDLDLRIFQP